MMDGYRQDTIDIFLQTNLTIDGWDLHFKRKVSRMRKVLLLAKLCLMVIAGPVLQMLYRLNIEGSKGGIGVWIETVSLHVISWIVVCLTIFFSIFTGKYRTMGRALSAKSATEGDIL